MQLAIPIFLKLDSFRCLSYVNRFQLLHIFFSFSDCNSFFLNQWLRFVCLFFFHVSIFLRTLTCSSFSSWGSSGCHGLVLALPSHLKPQLKEELGQSSCCYLLVGLSSVNLLCGHPTTAGVFSQSTPGGADARHSWGLLISWSKEWCLKACVMLHLFEGRQSSFSSASSQEKVIMKGFKGERRS